jgi:5-hydroxyisourate hydrolase
MTNHRSRVTTHILNAVSGRPAHNVAVTLEQQAVEGWQEIAYGHTDEDGRIAEFGPKDLSPGVYRMRFATGAYFAGQGSSAFYPEVMILFTLDDADAHYHVPLLLSPYAYSTYRGS